MTDTALSFLKQLHPYDALPDRAFHALWKDVMFRTYPAGTKIYDLGEELDGLYVVESGQVTVRDENGNVISQLQRENSFGERGLIKHGNAVTSAYAQDDCRLICIPPTVFHKLRADHEPFRRFFDRTRTTTSNDALDTFDLTRVQVETLMVPDPVTCAPAMTIQAAAQKMRED